ncbi:winged helix-turn-helix domain-containing protein [Micromonospora sp. NPDC000316]|uniref:helix-turn-helix domain-containing protein n=1 Tax=Micromonospora sp. NPDC000316 TaxID=3364216 RepID=UPI0036752431
MVAATGSTTATGSVTAAGQGGAERREHACNTFEIGVSKATRSHHLRVLREAGITRTRAAGTSRYVRLRRDELNKLYPGLLDAVLIPRPPASSFASRTE